MSTPHYADATVRLFHGDCLDILRELPDNSVDAVCTDPPYGLEFMGKDWDSFKTYAGGNPNMKPQGQSVGDSSGVTYGYRQKNPRCRKCGKLSRGNGCCKCPAPEWDTRTAESANQFQFWCELWATECLRVLKPGGHMLAFGGTRTFHRLACAVEDAGFEIRDSIAWLYGSGFPKSLDVSKAIDKARNDRPDVLAVTSRLADLAEAAGIGRADVDAHMGTSDMGGWWLSRIPHRCACPSVENWTRLREFIPGATDLDDEVWRLNGRKGSPGEAWTTREVIRERTMTQGGGTSLQIRMGEVREVRADITAPATDAARQWQGFGTAMKPAFEPVVVARKPLAGTVAANVTAWGTGALNVDGCRIGMSDEDRAKIDRMGGFGAPGWTRADGTRRDTLDAAGRSGPLPSIDAKAHASGRWPANVVLDESQAAALDQMSGETVSNERRATGRPIFKTSQSLKGGGEQVDGQATFEFGEESA